VAGSIGIAFAAILSLMVSILWSKHRLEQLVVETSNQRSRAERQERLARANEQLAANREQVAQNRAYAADMRLLAESWEISSGPTIHSFLDTYVPGNGGPDLRGFEWWMYHKRLKYDTPSKLLGVHVGGVQAVAVNAKGDLAASGGSDGIIRVWRIATAEILLELRGHKPGNISGLAFSSEGDQLASASDDNTVKVWDARSGKQLHCLVGHTAWVSSVIFLPDNNTLCSGSADKTIIVWDLKSGREKRRLRGHTDSVRTLVYQRSNAILVSAAEDRTVRVWDINQGTPSRRVPKGLLENPTRHWIRCLVLEPDQTTLIGIPFNDMPVAWEMRPDRFGTVWRPSAQGNVRCASLQGGAEHAMAAYGLEESFIHVFEFWRRDQKDLHVLRGHSDVVDSVALTPDTTRLVSGSQDGTVRLWNLDATNPFECSKTLASPIAKAAISPNGKLVAMTTVDGETTLLDFATLKTVRQIRPPGSTLGALAFSRDSTILATFSVGEPLRLESTGHMKKEFAVPRASRVHSLDSSPKGNLVAMACEPAIVLVDIERNAIRECTVEGGPAFDVAFIDNDQLLACTKAGSIVRLALHAGGRAETLPLREGELREIAISPDRHLAAVRALRQVKIVDLRRLEVVASLPDRDSRGGIAFVGNGRSLVVAGPSPTVWQVSTWQRMGTLGAQPVKLVGGTPDGNRLVISDDRRISTIDARPVK
jgi:WD40 repeat protein